jgi:hypothetical protein
MVYMILFYLNFLKDVLILTSYTSLDTLILNQDQKINNIKFI